ncbi:MAG TPA: glutamine--fructose-6-phosphate transaminase (isomerizing), partial [Candidatus Wirthbacteria bacterium]|nr:glutamine--fructose-6-phosphate transaminase (isomerizing) [Candidatus Wirthbacteria bacterium]
MCGIIGYTGSKQVLPILIEGLSKLEYRGYDSAGIAIITTEKLLVKKEIGKLENLRKKLDNSPIKGHCGIGHTRWATHGGVTQTNAHPHTDCSGKLAIIHNGIIENYLDLKADLASKGHDFKSQTDSEIMAHLIEEELKSIQKGSVQEDISHPLALAVYRATKQAEGGFALVVVHHDYPGTMIVSRMHNPLIIGLGEGENLIASDVPALLEHTKKVYDLKNEEIALIDQDQVLLYDSLGRHTKMKTRQINWDAQQAQKGGYPHFLIKEIHETPEILTNVLRGKVKGTKLNQETLGLADLDLGRINKVTFLACGSAAYACMYAKYLIEKWARITSEVFVGSEFRYHSPIIDQHTLVIAVSQSGETADTLASINLAKKFKPARIIGVINAIGSSLTREVDQVCHLQAGPEISVASTKALSSMLLTLALQALAIG